MSNFESYFNARINHIGRQVMNDFNRQADKVHREIEDIANKMEEERLLAKLRDIGLRWEIAHMSDEEKQRRVEALSRGF